ncbi:hypothetical protein FEM48_Zijuj03G0042800 [Ziziphus jujuba var. spinosa]|uniref:Uncharacterized protein n=1 Tax=Ziziphus jujuba var. spinosa TaxID=714518 RepID=A0A978VN48_ZIZJJ|nr:hypothetical protein FEM48_Zijuj03G0042800 [Ziziphus jujuba var. spinosa]
MPASRSQGQPHHSTSHWISPGYSITIRCRPTATPTIKNVSNLLCPTQIFTKFLSDCFLNLGIFFSDGRVLTDYLDTRV